MKLTKCPVCAGNIKKAFNKHNYVETYRYDKCLTCKHLFINPQPSKSQLETYYNGQYQVEPVQERKVRKKTRAVLKEMKRLNIPKGTVLDVGCSYGYASDEFQKNGFKTTGIELSTKTAKYAAKTYNMKVYDSITKIKDKFDIIIMFDVIEHVLDINKTITDLQKHLKKGGYFIITTPNTKSLEYTLFGKLWEWVSPPAHTHLFNTKNWDVFLTKHNFQKTYNSAWKGDSAGNTLFHACLSLRYLIANTIYAILPKKTTQRLYNATTQSIRKSANKKQKEFTGVMGFAHTITSVFEFCFKPLQRKAGPSIMAIYKNINKNN